MNTRSSSYTGRSARTTEEAFGPYARGPIDDGSPRWSTGDHIVVWFAVAAAAALFVMHFLEMLP